MRHGEIERGLARLVEEAHGIAVHEVECPHSLVVDGDGRLRRTGQPMSLGILDHGWLRCSQRRALWPQVWLYRVRPALAPRKVARKAPSKASPLARRGLP